MENLSLVEARKHIDRSKDKLQLIVARGSSQTKSYPSPSPFSQHEQPGKLADKSPSQYLCLKQMALYFKHSGCNLLLVTMIALNVVSLCFGEMYSFIVIDMDLDYVMCLVLHLILIILLGNIVSRLVMRAGWQPHSFC